MSETEKLRTLAKNTLNHTNHQRRQSRYEAVKFQLAPFVSEQEADKLSWEAVDNAEKEIKKPNGNGKSNEKADSVQEIVDKVMSQHSRKRSQFNALQSELGQLYDKKEVARITKKVMRDIFAKKAFKDADFVNEKNQIKVLEEKQLNFHKSQLHQLKDELVTKNNLIAELKQTVADIANQKLQLSVNINKEFEQMRSYLKKYQAVFNQTS